MKVVTLLLQGVRKVNDGCDFTSVGSRKVNDGCDFTSVGSRKTNVILHLQRISISKLLDQGIIFTRSCIRGS